MEEQQNAMKFGTKAFLAFFFDILETVVIAFVIFIIVYFFLASPHEVFGRSMEPNFHEGQFLLADKLTYRFRDPQRGEVVIFEYDDTHDYIKRVIGTPGDEVYVEDGFVYVNGEKLDESGYLDATVRTDNGNYMTPGRKEIVPDGKVFVLGDNRAHSSDSRNFGMIDYNQIKGRALIRYWPFDKMAVIQHIDY